MRTWRPPYIKADQNFIAFGSGEEVNPALDVGASMHPISWNLASLDASAESEVRALVMKAAS